MKELLVTLGEDDILIWHSNRGGGVAAGDGNTRPSALTIIAVTVIP